MERVANILKESRSGTLKGSRSGTLKGCPCTNSTNFENIVSRVLNEPQHTRYTCYTRYTPKQQRAYKSMNTIHTNNLTKSLQLADNYIDEDAQQLSNFTGTFFPKNTPCFIVGPKGSGKTYLLAGLLQHVVNGQDITRLFYVYSNNVDTTIMRAVGQFDGLYQIPKSQAYTFVVKYLNKKNKLISCYRFLMYSLNSDLPDNADIPAIKKSRHYWDNRLEEYSYKKKLEKYVDILSYCKKVVEKYYGHLSLQHVNANPNDMSGKTQIRINGNVFDIGRLTPYDYDMFVFDDIAQFSDLLGVNRHSSQLYQYFTITRQNLTTFYMTGQEIKQLPLMFREQLGCVVMFRGTSAEEVKSLHLPKNIYTEILANLPTLSTHECILYNYNENHLEVVRQE